VTPAERYLRLSYAYCDELGGLRWSFQEDAVITKDGSMFAFSEEIALFLEGFASCGRLIHFGYMLHMMQWLRETDHNPKPEIRKLNRAYAASWRQPRNAGAFCAILCRDLPDVAGPLDLQDIIDRLRSTSRPIRWYIVSFHDTFYPSEQPPLEPAAFEDKIVRMLAAYSDEELQQWLRYGRGPVREAAAALARALPAPPRSLSGVLAALLERPRLAGARPFVSQMLSALALPPRRRRRSELPVGGYADVTTQGQPDQLLPSQFALDSWDFLRRFADRELLYFRREEPHDRTRHELVVLLDQGVRTWGDVRLVLGAAVLALGRQAADGRLPFALATTSGEGRVLDPLQIDDDTLAAQVEASDLSPNPGLALERVIDHPVAGSRDVVLLTHPRNVQEEDVRAAALRAKPDTRVLSVTLDEHGQAALSELRHGVPVPIRTFRVDFRMGAPPPPDSEPVPNASGWQGDVEPVGFPFCFGTKRPVTQQDLFDFDYEGQWLLTATRDAMLHVWRTDGSNQVEILPRAMGFWGRFLTKVEAVVGVAGGFVVSCRFTEGLAVAHYDMGTRTCTAHRLPKVKDGHVWLYSPAHHVVLVHTPEAGFEHALDLSTGEIFPQGQGQARRAREAWYALAKDRPPAAVPSRKSWTISLDPTTGLIGFEPDSKPANSFVPLADGRPVLKGCTLLDAEYHGGILAVKVRGPRSTTVTLRLFRVAAGLPLAEYPLQHADFGFALSADGRLLARHCSGWRLDVRSTENDTGPLAATRSGGYSQPAQLILGETWLSVRTGKHNMHLLSWAGGRLDPVVAHGKQAGHDGRFLSFDPVVRRRLMARFGDGADREETVHGLAAGVPGSLHYDRYRFVEGATNGGMTVVLDRFGHLVVLDNHQELVCMFFVFRERLSGWLPDGTDFGPASPSGRPPAPEVLLKFGTALGRVTATRAGGMP
jgi:hypothetical protein